MMRFFEYSRFHAAFAAVFFILLLISAVSDEKTRRIPKGCSYGLLLISLMLLILEKQYVFAAYFTLAVFATGSKSEIRRSPYEHAFGMRLVFIS